MEYVELHARSACSFLRAASHPERLAAQAAHIGLPAMAVCDRDGLDGAGRCQLSGRFPGTTGHA